jgi:arylsulfatase A-like enzyme
MRLRRLGIRVFLGLGWLAVSIPAPAADKPNIIFILADDLGYGELGCYGQKQIKTPHIDRLAAEGIRFTDCYAGSTVCAPSRCTLMTGLHTGHARIRGNGTVPLRPNDVTVAEILQHSGYATALVGKWGLGEARTSGVPTKKGFDYFFGYLNQNHAHNYYPDFLWRNETKLPLPNMVPALAGHEFGSGVATKKVVYSCDLFAKEALDFVDQHSKSPFFLYLAFTIPHANNESRPNGMEVPDLGPYARETWPAPEKGKAAMITRMDSDVGRLVAKLRELGIDEKTVVFFTSDNGPHKEGGVDPNFFHSSGPLQGSKRSLHDGGIREPMLVRWPGKIAAGRVSHLPWAFWDVLPTLAELAGASAQIPAGIDGISVVPTLLDQGTQKQHEFMYWEFHEGPSQQAVRMGEWKAIRPRPGALLALYDLSHDLGERTNVAAEHPEIVTQIETYLKSARTASEQWPMRAPGSKAATPKKKAK